MASIKVGIRMRPIAEHPEAGEVLKISEQFDHVFGPATDTEEVFNSLCSTIVEDVILGINGTIFAYGQTASGKTYTMMGDKNTLGVIPLTVLKIFSIIEKRPDREFIVRVSYMELYKETITDLQDPTQTNLPIRQRNGQMVVYGLTETTCTCVNDVLDVLVECNDNRTIRETKMNTVSSRSHAIFSIIIESKESSDDIVQLSTLHLVDLAGSEKASDSICTQGFNEGRFINLSLMTLGTVISKLSSTCKDEHKHIPFRESKLTRFLQHSLGGNAKTAIICTICPLYIEESESTLKFAQRAKKIVNKPVINEVFLNDKAKDRKIAILMEENGNLKRQLEDVLTKAEQEMTDPASDTSNLISMKHKDIFLDSPLFKRQKSRLHIEPTKTTCKKEHQQVSFIPSYVTLRKKIFDTQSAYHDTDISGEFISEFSCDASVQTDDCCSFSVFDESYKCEHLSSYKQTARNLEELQFKYDEMDITSRDCQQTMTDQLRSLHLENQALKQQIEEFQVMKDKDKENEELQLEKDTLTKQLEGLQLLKEENKEKEESLQLELKALTKQLEELKSIIEKDKKREELLHLENVALIKQLEEVQTMKVETESVEVFQDKLDLLQLEKDALTKQLEEYQSIVEASKDREESLHLENFALAKQLEELQSIKEVQHVHVDLQEEMHESFQLEKEDLMKQLEELQSRLEENKNEEDKLMSTQLENETLMKQLEELQLNVTENKNEEIHEKLISFQSANETLMKQMEEFQYIIQENKSKEESFQLENETLTKQVEEFQSIIKETKEREESLHLENITLTKQLEEFHSIIEENKQEKDKLNSLQIEKELLEKQVKEYQSMIEENKEREIIEREDHIKLTVTKESELMRSKMEQLATQLEAVLADTTSIKEDTKFIQNELKYKEELEKCHCAQEALTQQLEELKSLKEKSQKREESLHLENVALTKQLEEFLSMIEENKKREVQEHDQFESIHLEKQSLRKQLEELQSLNEETKEREKSLQYEKETLMKQLQDYESLKEENRTLEAQISEFDKDKENLEEKVKEYEHTIMDNQQQMQTLSDEMDEQDVTIKNLKEELKNLKEQSEKLKTCEQKQLPNPDKYVLKELYDRSDATCYKLKTENNEIKNDLAKIIKLKDRYRTERSIYQAKYEKLQEQMKTKFLVPDPPSSQINETLTVASESNKESLAKTATPKLQDRSMFYHRVTTKLDAQQGKQQPPSQQKLSTSTRDTFNEPINPLVIQKEIQQQSQQKLTNYAINEPTKPQPPFMSLKQSTQQHSLQHTQPKPPSLTLPQQEATTKSFPWQQIKENIHPTASSSNSGTSAGVWTRSKSHTEATIYDLPMMDNKGSPEKIDWETSILEAPSHRTFPIKFREFKK